MKKFLSMVLAVMIAAGSVTAHAVEVESVGTVAMADGNLQIGDSFIKGDLEYTVLEDGTLEVSGLKNTPTQIVIPSEVNGKSVTSIGDYAFRNCRSLTSVIIPDSVIEIGISAFYNCSSLTSVTIPDSVTYIGSMAFCWCTGLTSAAMLADNIYIDGSAFYRCESLQSVTLPRELYLGTDAFGMCEKISNVYYGGTEKEWEELSLIYISRTGDSLFEAKVHCALKEEELPEEESSMKGTCGENLTWVLDDEGTLTISGTGAMYNYGRIFSFSSWSYVWYMPWDGIERNDIKSVLIKDRVTSIGQSAFHYCSSLTSVTIPDSVASIGDSAFYYCSSLTNVTIPDSVASIGDSAFYGCSSLTSVAIPNNIASIGQSAFNGCSSLTSVTIPDSVTSINGSTFSGCSSLTSVTIPDSVTSIGNYAFDECSSLESVTYNGTMAEWSAIEIGYNNKFFTYAEIICTDGIIKRRDPESGNSFIEGDLKYTVLDDSTLKISCPYDKKDTLTQVVIPSEVNGKSVTSIDDSAFSGCSSLTSVTIPDSVTSIGDSAFSSCSSLTSVTIPDSVAGIGEKAFYGCRSLTSVTIPDNVTSIGSSAFSNCTSLTTVSIPDSVTSIGSSAFFYCTKLTEINVDPENTKYCSVDGVLIDIDEGELIQYPIGKTQKFYTIPDNVTSIGGSAFYNCENLIAVDIPYGVTSIYHWAFVCCYNLTSLTIPSSVTNIGVCAISTQRSLKNVYYTGTKEQWENISIGGANDDLGYAKITYNYDYAKPQTVTGFNGTVSGNSVTLTWNSNDTADSYLIKRVVNDEFEEIAQISSNKYTINKLEPYTEYTFAIYAVQGTQLSTASTITVTTGEATVFTKDNIEYTVLGDKTLAVTYDGNDASTVTDITIPESVNGMSVSTIKKYGFLGLESLKNISLPDSIKTIEANAFMNCSSLEALTLPKNLGTIGEYAFQYCSKIKTLHIPPFVQNIGEGAFTGCTSLESFTTDSTSLYYRAFDGILYRYNTKDDYRVWLEKYPAAKKDTVYDVPSHFTSIGYGAFQDCANLERIILHSSIQQIDWYAFANCTSLCDIELPDGISVIGKYAFLNCVSLESLEIPSYVSEIDDGTFFNCKNLIAVRMPSMYLKSINNYAFANCVSLKSVFYHGSESSWASLKIGNYNDNLLNAEILYNKDHIELPDPVLTGLKADYVSDSSVTLVWDKCSTANYKVFVWNNNEWNELAEIKRGSELTYTVENLVPGTLYKFRIGAYKNDTEIASSDITITTQIEITIPIEIKVPETGAPDTSDMTVDISGNGVSVNLSIGEDGTVELGDISNGEYTFTFSAKNCAPRAYDVTVSNGSVNGLEDGVELHLYGDIDGDGKVNMKDVGKANAHAKNTARLSGYDLSVSDINGDGKINMQDVGLMNAHAKNTKSLW